MRISDWSSDVCSSDLAAWDDGAFLAGVDRSAAAGGLLHHLFGVRAAGLLGDLDPATAGAFLSGMVIGHELRAATGTGERAAVRSEECSVGKAGGSTCRSRGST